MKLLIQYLRHILRVQDVEELRGLDAVEERVARADGEEEAVLSRLGKMRHAEERMVGLRQAIEREHAQYGSERRAEDGALEHDDNECRPGIERPPADVDGIRDGRNPVLQRE